MEIRTIASFLPYFDGIRRRTRAVVDRIPADRLEWSHAPGRFTPGDLVRHLAATERWMFAENVQGKPSRYPGHGEDLASGRDGVLAFFERAHAESMEIFARLTPDDLARKCTTPGGASITTWKWLRAMVEHEVHHRGQLYVLLGILGVATPPLYGLTEPEVVAASLPRAPVPDGGQRGHHP